MKKHILLIISLFIVTYSFANESSVPTKEQPPQGSFAAEQDENKAIEVSKQLKLIPKTRHEEDKQLSYTVDVSYPELTGGKLPANAAKFNKEMVKAVEQEVDQFKKFVKQDSVHMQTLPADVQHNSLHIDYDIDVVKPGDHALISVRFSTEGYQAGRAHPYHMKNSINFDLATGKVLTLHELFKPGSHYLDFFAKYSKQKLNAKLADKFMINDGTKPTAKNFKNWNLEPDSIVITFDEYQVAPYYAGPQEVEISFKDLAKMISPKAPIYSCLKDSSDC